MLQLKFVKSVPSRASNEFFLCRNIQPFNLKKVKLSMASLLKIYSPPKFGVSLIFLFQLLVSSNVKKTCKYTAVEKIDKKIDKNTVNILFLYPSYNYSQ